MVKNGDIVILQGTKRTKSGMFFLSGEYDHQVDAKNRIRIPAKLRGAEEKLFFARGTDDCICVMYESEMSEYMEQIRRVGMFGADKLRGARRFAASIKPVDMDQQGRFVIPPELMAHAKIVKDVKICGAGDRIEIWAKEVYDKYLSLSNYDDDIRTLGNE